ncbi:MAG: ribonuclease D [Gammaproteobacteria bacterium]|nr:MAG: ribonuclease D [Gammaproteobacteria bacterium]
MSRAVPFIDTPGALRGLCERLAGAPWLALDTEFIRERTYRPRLCLVQVATPETLACIDPLAVELEPLLEVLFEPQRTLVMHAARQDLEIFYQLRGRLPARVFDTQLAAPLLGLPEQIGYAGLVKALLGVELGKGHARTDWCARPLTAGQLAYAADDVRYLARLYPELRRRLEACGRLDWLEEEFAALRDPAGYETPEAEAWRRIKGIGRLKGRSLAIAQALAAWRERTAREADLPRRWVLDDEALLGIARLAPRTKAELRRVRGPREDRLAKYADAILAVVAKARDRAPEPLAEGRRPPPLEPAQEAAIDLLAGALRLLAERHRIHPNVLANRKALEQLVRGERDLPLLRGWRRELAGEHLLAVLEGREAVTIVDGRLQFVHADTHRPHPPR